MHENGLYPLPFDINTSLSTHQVAKDPLQVSATT
jgi:hypothetical protein